MFDNNDLVLWHRIADLKKSRSLSIQAISQLLRDELGVDNQSSQTGANGGQTPMQTYSKGGQTGHDVILRKDHEALVEKERQLYEDLKLFHERERKLLEAPKGELRLWKGIALVLVLVVVGLVVLLVWVIYVFQLI